MNRKSLVGNRFGKLIVTDMTYGENARGRKRSKSRCICDCGNEIVTTVDALRRGKTSCGCDTRQKRSESNRKDLTGKRFNRLVVETMLWEVHPSRAICSCDCGNTVTVIANGLTSGKTGSCGCLQKDRASETSTKDWTGVVSTNGIKFLRQSKKNSKNQWLWECSCGVCGGVFVALPARVMNNHITSCGCRKRSSREDMIRNFLELHGVEFAEQYRIKGCKDRYTLPFDFAIMSNQTVKALIEYDGQQHYKAVSCFGGQAGFANTVRRDKIKDAYCQDNNIHLLRLPYTLTDDEIKNKLLDIIYP